MKYMIMFFASQQNYDAMAGKDTGQGAWSKEDFAAMETFMQRWNEESLESGEFVDAHGLTAPVHTRRIQLKNGVPVVTDGPYPETQEVLAGYTIVECESYDRATELAARIAECPTPGDPEDDYVEIRPIMADAGELVS